MANIESVKVYFDTQKIEQKNEITDIKILMLKGEKGDTVSTEWGLITGDITDQQDLNQKLGTIENDIESNSGNISSLNTRLVEAEGDITNLDTRVTTNTNNLIVTPLQTTTAVSLEITGNAGIKGKI